MQVAGNASFSSPSNSFGGSFGYGQPGGVFGSAQLGTTSFDGLDGSQMDIGLQGGYQMTVGKGQMQVCPVASFGIGMGPKDIGGTGIDASSNIGTLGLALGKVMGTNPRMKFVPNASLALAHSKQKLDDGTTSLEFSETYGQASLGVGFIFNSNIAVRPSVSIPLGSDLNNDPTFGVTVAYNFGTKAAPARKR
jgi:outer membrane autotransporter protein